MAGGDGGWQTVTNKKGQSKAKLTFGGGHGGAGPTPSESAHWTCGACGTGANWGTRTECRKCGKKRPKAQGGRGTAKPLDPKTEAKQLDSAKAEIKKLKEALAKVAEPQATGSSPPWTADKPSIIETLLDRQKQLAQVESTFAGGELPEWLPKAQQDTDKQLQEARAARDKAKPMAVQLRDAAAKTAKAQKQVEQAAEAARKAQEALVGLQAQLQEARQAEAAARAHELELQARDAAERPAPQARTTANDVDVLRVQLEQLAAKAGRSLEDYGSFDLGRLAADVGQQQAAAEPTGPPGQPAGPGGGAPPAAGQPEAEAGGAAGMSVDQEATPDLTEEERDWLNGKQPVPNREAHPEQHKRYLDVLQKQHGYQLKRQRLG